MKKLFITIAFVAATFFAQAQLFVGGSFGMDYAKNLPGVEKTVSFSIVPTVGYMFAENMGVGADLGYVYSKDTYYGGGDFKESAFVFAPFFRYVFANLNKFDFYADAKVNLKFGKHGDDSATGFGIAVIPGVAYNLTDNIAVIANLNVLRLGFQYEKIEGQDATNAFGLGFNENTPLSIGFVYNF
jgi:hypothetical protein